MPGGNPDGGQWTDAEGGGHTRLSTDLSAVRRKPPGRSPPRSGFQELNPSLDQQIRYGEATRRADQALAEVRRFDPNWSPTLGAYDDRAESRIRRVTDEALEAEKRYAELIREAPSQGALPPGPGTQSTEDILAPSGRPIGVRARGAGDNIRTVTPREFYSASDRLRDGSEPTDVPSRYEGIKYRRFDDTVVGLRFGENGLTLDVLESNNPRIPRGFRVHQR